MSVGTKMEQFISLDGFQDWLENRDPNGSFEDGSSRNRCVIGTWANEFWEGAAIDYHNLYRDHEEPAYLEDWQQGISILADLLSMYREDHRKSEAISNEEALTLLEIALENEIDDDNSVRCIALLREAGLLDSEEVA